MSCFGALEFLNWDHDWNAHHYAGDKPERAVALMKEAGVGFIRMDFLWDDVEPHPGGFTFQKYDRLVGLLSRNGIRVLGLLDYNTPWGGSHWNRAPNPERFTDYARAVVRRYRDRVKFWEIWNEPDQAIYWVPQDDLKAYTALMKRVYPALKEEDPACRVLLGGLSGGAAGPLKKIYANGGRTYFDIVNIHPFVSPLEPNAAAKLRGILDDVEAAMRAARDDGKPIWITEIGCPGLKKPSRMKNWWLGTNPDETQQADWVSRVYAEMAGRPAVKKVFWAFFRDTPGHFADGTDAFGLVREDFSKKPAFEVYKRLANPF